MQRHGDVHYCGDLVGEAVHVGSRGLELPHYRLVNVPVDHQEEVVFCGEVVVQGADGQVRSLGDRFGRGAAVAVPAELGTRDAQDAGAGLGGVAGRRPTKWIRAWFHNLGAPSSRRALG